MLSIAGDNRRWWYRGDTGNWLREADFTDPTNAIEFPDTMIAYMPYMLAVILAPEFNTELRQDVIAADALGRATMARAYAPARPQRDRSAAGRAGEGAGGEQSAEAGGLC